MCVFKNISQSVSAGGERQGTVGYNKIAKTNTSENSYDTWELQNFRTFRTHISLLISKTRKIIFSAMMAVTTYVRYLPLFTLQRAFAFSDSQTDIAAGSQDLVGSADRRSLVKRCQIILRGKAPFVLYPNSIMHLLLF